MALNDETNNKRLLIHLKTNGEYEKLDISNIIDEVYLDTWGEDQFGILYFSNKNKVFTLRDGSWQIFCICSGNSFPDTFQNSHLTKKIICGFLWERKAFFSKMAQSLIWLQSLIPLRPQDPYVYDIVSTKDGNMYFRYIIPFTC